MSLGGKILTRYDLHIHTVLSDGQLSPYSIIEKAKREGLETISITDHETIIHFKEFKGFADNCGIELIPGIEINVGGYYNYHFLGYGIQDFDKLEKYLLELKKANEIVCLKTLDLLKEKFNISFSAEDLIKKHSKTGVLDKKVIVKELIARGYARGTKEAYDLYIGRDAPAYCPIKKISDEQVIKLIHDCGGICVWAHPTLAKYKIGEAEHDFDRAKCQEIAKRLSKLGLDGIEVYDSTTREQQDFLKEIAAENNLVITGGSDFHEMQSGHALGCQELTAFDICQIKGKMEERKEIYNKENKVNERFSGQDKTF